MTEDEHDIRYKNTWGTPLCQDCIDLDGALARWLGDRLIFLSCHTNSYPSSYETHTYWQQDLHIHGIALHEYGQFDMEMDDAEEESRLEKAQEAMRWIAEHFGELWD